MELKCLGPLVTADWKSGERRFVVKWHGRYCSDARCQTQHCPSAWPDPL